MPPSLISLIWVLAAVAIAGVLLWALQQIPWIDDGIKLVLRLIVIVCVAIWLIYFLATMATSFAGLPAHR